MEGTINGFEAVDGDNEKVFLFLDFIGLIADYSTISEAIDELGHKANAPCHLCFFRLYEMFGSGSSTYGYSTAMDSFTLGLVKRMKVWKLLGKAWFLETG